MVMIADSGETTALMTELGELDLALERLGQDGADPRLARGGKHSHIGGDVRGEVLLIGIWR